MIWFDFKLIYIFSGNTREQNLFQDYVQVKTALWIHSNRPIKSELNLVTMIHASNPFTDFDITIAIFNKSFNLQNSGCSELSEREVVFEGSQVLAAEGRDSTCKLGVASYDPEELGGWKWIETAELSVVWFVIHFLISTLLFPVGLYSLLKRLCVNDSNSNPKAGDNLTGQLY